MSEPIDDRPPPSHARPIVVGVCPRCAGTGNEDVTSDGVIVTCTRCEGDGDLDAYRLKSAYLLGREEALRDVRAAIGQVQAIMDRPAAPMTMRRLRAAVGG